VGDRGGGGGGAKQKEKSLKNIREKDKVLASIACLADIEDEGKNDRAKRSKPQCWTTKPVKCT